MESTITPDVKNASLSKIHEKTCSYMNNLRFNLTSKKRVSKSVFNDFKRSFGMLYNLTANRRELKDSDSVDLINRTNEWLNLKTIIPKKSIAQKGIDLFLEYQNMMILTSLINDKQ